MSHWVTSKLLTHCLELDSRVASVQRFTTGKFVQSWHVGFIGSSLGCQTRCSGPLWEFHQYRPSPSAMVKQVCPMEVTWKSLEYTNGIKWIRSGWYLKCLRMCIIWIWQADATLGTPFGITSTQPKTLQGVSGQGINGIKIQVYSLYKTVAEYKHVYSTVSKSTKNDYFVLRRFTYILFHYIFSSKWLYK